MLKLVPVLLGLLIALGACSDRLTAHESLCKRYPREHGQIALASAHRFFEQRGWRYSDWHPTSKVNVFHTKADAGDVWVQLNNDIDMDVIHISVFSFLEDEVASRRKVKEVSAVIRGWSLPPAPPSRSRIRQVAPRRDEPAACD